MTTYKTSELTGDLLNRAVAKAIDYKIDDWIKDAGIAYHFGKLLIMGSGGKEFNPVDNWGQCGQLVDKFDINVKTRRFGEFKKDYQCDIFGNFHSVADDRKTAVCRCVVTSVFGDEVDL